MRVVHLMASPFYGGPERQMLGLARHLPSEVESIFLSFAERGLAQAFLDEVRQKVPAETPLLVLDAKGPLDPSWLLYYLNGRGTMLLKTTANGLSANFNLVYYIVNGNTVLLFDSDSNRVANGVLSLQF